MIPWGKVAREHPALIYAPVLRGMCFDLAHGPVQLPAEKFFVVDINASPRVVGAGREFSHPAAVLFQVCPDFCGLLSQVL